MGFHHSRLEGIVSATPTPLRSDGALDHAARGGDDVEVGLVGPLRFAHIGHFDQRQSRPLPGASR